MQINSTPQQTHAVNGASEPMTEKASSSAYRAEVAAVQPLPKLTESVTLSAESMVLSQQSATTAKDESIASAPTLPDEREKPDNYVEYRKAKAQYQIYSDMAGVVTGNHDAMSPASAYYIANNDEARDALVSAKAQQQQISTMQTYVETTQSIYEQA